LIGTIENSVINSFRIHIRALGLALSLASGLLAQNVPVNPDFHRRVSFNQDWKFLKGDATNAERPDFNDSGWRTVELPHDWAIEGPFALEYGPSQGGLPYYGTGWYRKRFTLPAGAVTRRYAIEFDGAMSNAKVWLNGAELGGRPYGYIGFSFDLTPQLRFDGAENVIVVRLTPEKDSSRWYPGAGIYRNVWLDVTAPVHVARWGTYLTTPNVSDASASVEIKTDIRNDRGVAGKITLETLIVDAGGREVAKVTNDANLTPHESTSIDVKLQVKNPERWDITRPYLYRAVSIVKDGATEIDRYETPFGIRTIAFDKDKGFLLNGKQVKLQGVCLHHDLGALGSAVSRRATERQLQIMKSMGVNAVRTSHNPPSPELLDLCDRLGLLVMDEAFDMWRIPKVKNGYSKFFDEWSDRDLRDMIHRDRNHPSVIMWSIGNEIPEQRNADGAAIAERLTTISHREDPTRKTTSAFDQWPNAIKNGMAAQVDLPGFNYKPMHYGEVLESHPNWIILGTETASTLSSRGVYHLPMEKYTKHPSLNLTSYDIIVPPWATLPDVEFAEQDKNPKVLGEFVWTGFDYLGEPTPYFMGNDPKDWPSRSSYFGAVDLAGFPKDRYYLYQSRWTTEPMVHVLPHWNWPGYEGKDIPVMAYTNCDEVELFVNGKSLGRKQRFSEPVTLPVGQNTSKDLKFASKYRLLWNVPYEPGSLKLVGYKDGKVAATDEVRTAGAPAKIELIPDRATIQADGQDLSFVTVRIVDANGVFCPMADNLVQFKVTGAGRIAAVDNGNPATTEPFQADYRKAFNGLALLIVRSNRGQSGPVEVTATSPGLAASTIDLTAAGDKM
jgi:beta-galactosidase